MKFEWQETVRREMELTPDQVRKAFGLGGTTDDQLPTRVACLWPLLRYRLTDISDAGKAEAHYHPGDGKPGDRNAPPCFCDEPGAAVRADSTPTCAGVVNVGTGAAKLLAIDGFDVCDL